MNFHTSRIPFRKIPATNAGFAPKYLYLEDLSLKFGQNVKLKYLMRQVPTKVLTSCKNKFKLLKVLCFKKKDEYQITAFLKL